MATRIIDKIVMHPNSMLQSNALSGASRYRRAIFILGIPGFFISVNGGIWQLYRRREKLQQLEDLKNLKNDPIKELPNDQNPGKHMQPCVFEGVFDNEGSILVGPRPQPNNATRTKGDNSQGGFYIMTPFQISATGEVIMVNRGWVPIDAGKSRLHMVQYIGEGFKRHRLRGILRREELLTTKTGKVKPENFNPRPGGMAWDAFRPKDQAIAYFRRRFGIANVESRVEQHGTHNYYIEMIEDLSGDDQVYIKNEVWPFRRDSNELHYQKLPASTHLGYAIFWICMATFFGSMMYGMRGVVTGRIQAQKASIHNEKVQKEWMDESKKAFKNSKFYKESLPKESKAAPADTSIDPSRHL